jgi:hypothetical protein
MPPNATSRVRCGYYVGRSNDLVVIDTEPGVARNEPRFSVETALFIAKEILRSVSGILSERAGTVISLEVTAKVGN